MRVYQHVPPAMAPGDDIQTTHKFDKAFVGGVGISEDGLMTPVVE